jgi:hypothetical protein
MDRRIVHNVAIVGQLRHNFELDRAFRDSLRKLIEAEVCALRRGCCVLTQRKKLFIVGNGMGVSPDLTSLAPVIKVRRWNQSSGLRMNRAEPSQNDVEVKAFSATTVVGK